MKIYLIYFSIRLKRFLNVSIILGSGALSGKMLLLRIIENSEIDAYFRSG